MNQTIAKQLIGIKVLMASTAADGHFNPLTGLAKFLINAGADVRWYTSEIYSGKLKQLDIPHYTLSKARDVNGQNLHDLFPRRKFITGAGEKVNFDMINIFIKPGPGQCEDIADIRKSFPFEVIIADSMFPAIPYLHEKLKVPVLAIGIIPLAENSKDLGPYGPGIYPRETGEEYKRPAELNKRFTDPIYKESADFLSDLLNKNGIAHEWSNYTNLLIKKADLYLQIGSPSFEYKRSDLGDNIRYIGALLPYSNNADEKQWYDKRLDVYNKVVLVTQGTIENDMTKLLEPTLEAFKDSDMLVIATTGGNHTSMLREKYNFDNIIIEDYIPFQQVMPFAGVYISNGGYGGTILSIKNKLPIVAAGLHEGKAEICARLGYFKYGINLKTERPTAEEIRSAVEVVLEDPVYKNNIANLALEMAHYDAEELCAAYLVQLMNRSVDSKL